MAHLAFYTVALLRAPYYEPEIGPLGELLGPVSEVARSREGCLGVAMLEETADGRDWGEVVFPATFQQGAQEMRVLATLSLWEEMESVFAFTYNGLHGEAFKRRKEWFVQTDRPGYVGWWVAEGETPTWAEACERYGRYCEVGATAEGFDFKRPFDVDGNEVKLDRERVRVKAAQF